MAAVAPAPAFSASGIYPAFPGLARRKLRVGVFADGARQPRWIVEALAKVASSEFAELSVLCVGNSGPSRLAASSLWSAYRGVDRWLFGTDGSEPRDLEPLVPASRRMAVDDARIREMRLDVAFALGDLDNAGLEGLARCGVWRFCFGEGQGTCEALAGVREVIDAAPVTASGIRIHFGRGLPDRIAYRSWARTLPFSIARSRGNLLAKTSEFMARALRELHASGWSWLEHGTVTATPAAEERLPAGAELARLGARVARRAAEKVLTVEQWSLAYRFAATEPWSGSLDGFFRLTPPPDRFWADPFPIQRNGRSFIFFEELPFGAGKAHISVVEVDRDGKASEPRRVLERDHHLSYPFLVEDQGELYMIPESAINHTVEIHRCVEFPYKWRRERVLLDGVFCADATVHRAGDRWWMFANAAADGAEIHDELHLFSADRLLGDWKPHRRNPVKSDVRGARPAGALFSEGGELYRPAQICAPIYGSGIALQRVTRLDAEDYAEEEVRRIVPGTGAGVLGIHTINRAGDLSVTDAFMRRSRIRGPR